MPFWIAQALRALATGGLIGAGFEAAGNIFEGGGGQGQLAIPGRQGGGGIIPLVPDVIERALGIRGRDPFRRRRRRRRALTASDRADIAFIASILGKPAGANFAAQLASRPR